ncbi:hypothetical protein JX266_006532 [Neoarthrinium moseri]|nr:hypothetical protein JX266_006532 [Neoarthrinium moseri]
MDSFFTFSDGVPKLEEDLWEFVGDWRPQVAPGVDPARSMEFLRPVGPPPSGCCQPPREPWRLAEQYQGSRDSSAVRLRQMMDIVRPNPLFALPLEAAGASQRMIEEPTQFRDIASYLDTGRDENGVDVVIEANCVICGRMLMLPDRVSQDRYPDADFEHLVVTPCGHLFGAHCLESHLQCVDEITEEQAQHDPFMEFRFRDCPVCRTELVYTDCKCRIPLRPYNPQFLRWPQVPLTFAEGGRIPRACRVCTLQEAEDEAVAFMNFLMPGVPPHMLIDPDVVGQDQISAARRLMLAQLKEAARWELNAINRW